MELLIAAGITKGWPGHERPVLDEADLELGDGSVTSLHGRNGSGKTTLLRILAGIIAPERGTVRLDGLEPRRHRREYHRRVGLVSAGDRGLHARLTVRQHLDYAARLALLPDRAPRVREAVAALELDDIAGRRVDRLSMGQRQRVRIALAVLHTPRLLLLDEPLTSLDEPAVAVTARALEGLRARGGACLVASPEGVAGALPVDRSLVLEGGKLREP